MALTLLLELPVSYDWQHDSHKFWYYSNGLTSSRLLPW
jgi:hypothetical protein